MVSTATKLAWAVLSLGAQYAFALDNGVARLPVMGYNNWNAFQCDINEARVLQTANLMKSLGLQDVGYTHVNIDDCYAQKNRSANGHIVADPVKFPSGFNNLTSQLHSLGFKAGIYGDSGWFTCAGFPGSFANEARDIKTFQDWGFDYLKYDNCAIPYDNITRQNTLGKYERMADAINQLAKTSGKPPMIFSLCEWGWSQVWLWGKQFGQSWRTLGDIEPTWASLASIINFNSFITMATDFSGRNDMDMLQIGNGNMTIDEAKSHWTAWALMKSPLLIGTDLTKLSKDNLNILKNKEIIAIHQDPVVGTSISPFAWGVNPDWTSDPAHPAGYWSGPTQDGTVIMLLNTLDTPTDMSFNLTQSPWLRAGRQYKIRDLWAHTDNGTAVRSITAHQVPPHGVVALLLKDNGDEPAGTLPLCALWWQCTGQDGSRVPGS